MAAAAVGGCMMPAYLNPGVSHNPFISKLASMDIMEFIGAHASTTVTLGLISIICITITCFVLGDFSKAANTQQAIEKASNEVEHPNILFAIAPIVSCRSLWSLLLSGSKN